MTNSAEEGSSPKTLVVIREPSSHTLSNSKPPAIASGAVPPSFKWLSGSWYVTHSTLPIWKSKCNVRISYSTLSGKADEGSGIMPDINDLVEYQKSPTSSVSSVNGISRPAEVNGLERGLAFSWRGKGWLMIATSQWEILGWGEDTGKPAPAEGERGDASWVVTFFSKTLFTPAGLDIYCRSPDGLSEKALGEIKEAFTTVKEPSVKALAETFFEIPRSS